MDLDRDEWLRRRRNYLGGSDAPAALGLSPYTSRYELWEDKMGKPADIPTAVMERGNLLEAVVAELYRRRTDHETVDAEWIASPEFPWMAATLDLRDVTEEALVQIKTHSIWQADRYGNPNKPTAPDYEVIQCQHEMIVAGAQVNYLIALLADESAFRGMVHMCKGGFRPESIADHAETLIADGMAQLVGPLRIEYDEDLAAQIVEGERTFWEGYVVPGLSPPDASTPQTSKDIIDANESETEMLRLLAEAKRDENAAKERYGEQKGRIIECIGGASGIVARDVAKINYKAEAEYDVVAWADVARSLAKHLGKPVPELDTWESLAKVLGLDAGS